MKKKKNLVGSKICGVRRERDRMREFPFMLKNFSSFFLKKYLLWAGQAFCFALSLLGAAALNNASRLENVR
jgi:hypothetical protein